MLHCLVCYSFPPASPAQNFLTIVSYLFVRMPVHSSVYSKYSEDTTRFVQRVGEVPDTVRARTDMYNTKVRTMFINYLKDYATANADSAVLTAEHLRLPLSGVTFPTSTAVAAEGGLVATLRKASRPALLRTPFLAIEGTGDDFATITRVGAELRGGMFISPAQVPVFDEGKWVLNRFAQDFYYGGKKTRFGILGANGLSLHEAQLR